MANMRQVVVVRRDLNMTPGLMAAQVAHISDQWMREAIASDDGYEYTVDQLEWAKDPYLSVLAVDNPEELDFVAEAAKRANLDVNFWYDLIPSPNLKTSIPDVMVGISIGPADFDEIKAITGNLPLA